MKMEVLMKHGRNSSIATVSRGLIAAALCVHLPIAVWADDAGGLKPESASLDAAAQSTTLSTTTPPSETTLFGGVRKHQDSLDSGATGSGQRKPEELNATDNDAKLQAEKAVADAYNLAAQKLSSGAEMSSDDYRALQIGTTGIESSKTILQKYATVIAVYPGSPADLAGIRKGEKEIWHNTKANAVQRIQVTFRRAGSTVEVTLVRDGQPVNFTLLNQNIEDIQDPKMRRKWEGLVRRLGVREGVFIGTNLHDLSEAR
jgi:hypothetical protein